MQKHESVITDDWDHCYICGGQPTHCHHALHGSYKKKADKYKLVIPLCYLCHQKLHDQGLNDKIIQAIAQEKFEKHYPNEDFLKIFGRNFK